ncbi:MAG: CGNR zinc finger domain-containing protein [Solirubrobacteraceae bacterium]
MVSSELPPHDLQLVLDFVNTLDVASGEDLLSTPEALGRWLGERRLTDTRAWVGPDELTSAIDLREGLRTTLRSHTRGDSEPCEALEPIARRGRLSISFAGDGAVAITARAGDCDAALARLLVPVAYAALDGTWQRVKVCDADACSEAFYDRSRNRSARWCDMSVCGNRTKVRAYRAKRGP